MKTKLHNLTAKLLASYWFIPSAMCLASGAAALLALRYDARAPASVHHAWSGWIGVNTAEGARQLLATIAGSTITIAGVIFSITLLVLSFTSSHYGPRLLRNFMRDRPSQVVLGAFVSVYLYCLLVLRTIGHDTALPHSAIAGAMVLAILNIGVLVFFIHHIARAIQVSSIIAGVGQDLDVLVHEFLRGADARPAPPREAPPDPAESSAPAAARPVFADAQGYIQALSREDLLALAADLPGEIELHVQPGDYVSRGLRVATLRAPADALADENLPARLRAALVLGRERTNEQDLEFPLDQLAEIAVRALSPGVNDPFTALHSIHRLGDSLAELARHPWPERVFRDDRGRVRVRLPDAGLDRLLGRAFDQILHFGGDNPAIRRQLLAALVFAAESARPEHLGFLRAYADLVLRRARGGPDAEKNAELAALHARVHAPPEQKA